MSLSNLKTRTLTGILLVGTIVTASLVHPYFFAFVFGLVAFFTTLEFVKMLNIKKEFSIFPWLIGVISIFIYTLISLVTFKILPLKFLFLIFLIVPVFLIFELYRKKDNVVFNVLGSLFSIFYTTIPFALLTGIRNFEIEGTQSSYFVLIYFFIIWIYDSGAYLIGSKFGKKRLFERISPKKSWEGFWGGLVCSMIFAFFVHLNFSFMSFPEWMFLSLMIVIIATFGDLSESMFKRDVGIKDSGKILPGHGGLMDRFDAILLSAPFVFIYLQLI